MCALLLKTLIIIVWWNCKDCEPAHLLLKPCILCLQDEKIKKKSICVTHSEYRWAILRTIETNPQNPAKSTNNSKYNPAVLKTHYQF